MAGNVRRHIYLVALLGLVLLLGWGYPLRERALSGENDFLQLYAGARLVGTAELYEPEASYRIFREVTRAGAEFPGIYYTRPPFYALLLKPLAALPYRVAYGIFQLVSVTLVGVFVAVYGRGFPELVVLMAFSPVLLVTVANGQDAGMAVALAGLSFWWARERPVVAGLLVSLCSIKFHLFLLVPVAVVVKRQWRYLAGAAAGLAVLVGVSTVAAGWGWWNGYWKLLATSSLHEDTGSMPAWRGVIYGMLGRDWVAGEVALGVATAALVGWVARRVQDLRLALSLSLTAGVLVSHHAYLQDLFVLFLTAATAGAAEGYKRLRVAAFVMALPPVGLLVFAGAPWAAAAPLGLLLLLLIALHDSYHGERRPG